MIREISLMKSIGQHPNLLSLLGCVTDEKSPVICTEFCARGDLLHLLRAHPLHFADARRCGLAPLCFLLADILSIGEQVASGMVGLECQLIL